MDNHKRNFYYDNAKTILIFLVVFVHAFSPDRGEISKGVYENFLTRNHFCIALVTVLHLFIIPSFLIISGYFSSTEITNRSVKNVIEKTLWPLLVFDLLFKLTVPNDINPTDLFTEHFYILWFLGILLIYKFLAPYLEKLNLLFALTVVLILSFTAHFEYQYLEWGGTNLVKYMPYFLIGMMLKDKKIDLSQVKVLKRWKILSIALFLNSFFIIYFMKVDFNEVLASGDAEHLSLGIRLIIKKYDTLPSISIDAIYRIISVVLCFSFLLLVPKKKTLYSNFGQYTLYVYLLHIFIIHFVLDLGFKIYAHKASEWWYYAFLISTTIGLIPVLSSRFIRSVFKWAISPDFDKGFLKGIYKNEDS